MSLTTEIETPDLPIQNGTEPIGPLSELALREPAALENQFESELDIARKQAPRPITSSFDLPLFKDRSAKQDAPLVTPAAVPRAPLAVRRATIPAAPRPRRGGAAAAEAADHEPRLALETAGMPAIAGARSDPDGSAAIASAPILARLGAGLLDFVIIAGIDLSVVYFTLKICDLTFAEFGALPLAPLLAFIALVDGGYFATFVAAGGQTIGKMATGIRVIPADPGASAAARVPFGHAIVRAAAYLASALPAGLGFVPALIGERRALHDRLADTRVVKA